MLRLERSSDAAAHWSEPQYRALVGAQNSGVSTLALVAECDVNRSVVGFLIARHVGDEWELENVVVALEARGRGIATRLMEELLAHVRDTNCQAVFLEVRESNTAAISLYKKLGFQRTGRRKSYYSNPVEDGLLYCKKLGRATISS